MKQDYMKQYLSKENYKNLIAEELGGLLADRSPLFDLMKRISAIQGEIVESYLKLRVRKKPLWLPNFLWKFILSKLVYIQYLEAGE